MSTQRFVTSGGGGVVKICDNGIVYCFLKSAPPLLIPYGKIVQLKLTGLGIKIRTQDGWSQVIHIDEYQRLKQAVGAVAHKIGAPAYDTEDGLVFSEDDLKFLEIGRKHKQNEELTQEEKAYLGSDVESQETIKKRNRSITILGIILVIVAALAIVLAIASLPQKEKSEWSQLTEEEQDRIKDNMQFYDDAKEAWDEYQK